VYGDFRDKYIWSENNPYQDVAMPLPLAMDFINKGRNNEAIMALEAHLQKNQDDSERWRVLGRVLQ
jgi:cytochrome c-type biogenesis protein CcmH/NrfG